MLSDVAISLNTVSAILLSVTGFMVIAFWAILVSTVLCRSALARSPPLV